MDLQEIVQLNFLPLMSIVFMLMFIRINHSFEPNITKLFLSPILSLFLLVITDNMDYFECSKNTPSIWHYISAYAGYNLRLLILIRMCLIILRDHQFTKTQKIWMWVPFTINLCIISTCFFTDWVFTYDSNNQMIRGPLGYSTHIVCLIYSSFMVYVAIQLFIRRVKKYEGIVICCSVFFMLLATFLESYFQLRGILMGMIILAITFYYMYLHVQHFKIDVLTGAFSRGSFYADIKRYDKNISHILSIDMNNLKRINDTEGHDAGDKVLKKISNIIMKRLLSGCFFYRTGGDEFFIIAVGKDDVSVQGMMTDIRDAMDKTEYTFAVGVSSLDGKKTINDIIKEADKRMYKDKVKMKKKLKEEEKIKNGRTESTK